MPGSDSLRLAFFRKKEEKLNCESRLSCLEFTVDIVKQHKTFKKGMKRQN